MMKQKSSILLNLDLGVELFLAFVMKWKVCIKHYCIPTYDPCHEKALGSLELYADYHYFSGNTMAT